MTAEKGKSSERTPPTLQVPPRCAVTSTRRVLGNQLRMRHVHSARMEPLSDAAAPFAAHRQPAPGEPSASVTCLLGCESSPVSTGCARHPAQRIGVAGLPVPLLIAEVLGDLFVERGLRGLSVHWSSACGRGLKRQLVPEGSTLMRSQSGAGTDPAKRMDNTPGPTRPKAIALMAHK